MATPLKTEITPTPEQMRAWRSDPLCKRAVAAHGMLVKKGCEGHIINGYLLRISGYRDISFAPPFVFGEQLYRINREILGLSRAIRKTARKADELRKLWAVWGRFVTAGCVDAPEELTLIAERTYKAYKLKPSMHNSHRAAILDLLDLVKRNTGRYHYSEVADLINARLFRQSILLGEQQPEIDYDVPALRKMIQRQEQRFRSKANSARTQRAPRTPRQKN